MRVNLLGPFEVYTGEKAVNSAPAAQKVRQILAILALNANRVVRSSQLVEELWADSPPISAGTALQTYIYQIRKKFELGSPRGGPARPTLAGPALSTVDGGYHLSLPDQHVDVFRFEPLVRKARQAFQAGDLSRTHDSLTSAMALWRDTALVDVRKGSVLEAETLRLTELHASARDLRTETDLRRGRHQEILGELAALAAREPTNEGAQRHLMLALYRADRRADALRVYQNVREAIADDLGLDPSPELRSLHTAILNCDESVLRPPAPTTITVGLGTPAVQAPSHLPPPQARLVGRRGQLARLSVALQPRTEGRAVVLVSGPLASGKSELCRHAAEQASRHYPDGQLYGRLTDDEGRPVAPTTLLRSFLRGLGTTDDQLPAGTNDLALMFRTWTTERRLLVVLDDVTSATDLTALMPTGKGCGVLINSRRRLFLPSATEQVELDRLPFDDSVQVLGAAVADHRITMDPAGVHRLAELCHGLPGALFTVAGTLRLRSHWSAGRAIDWITASCQAGDDPLGIRSGLDRSLAMLSFPVRSAFDALFTPDGPARLAPETAAALLGTDRHRAEGLLEELVEAYLLRPSPADAGIGFSYAWEPALEMLRAPLPAAVPSGAQAPRAMAA